MRKAICIILALAAIRLLPRALRAEARALGLFAMLVQSLAMSGAPNSSKVYANEARTASLETRVGNLEQGQIVNLQSGSTFGTLQATVTTLNHDVGVLLPIVNAGGTTVAFLAGLSKTQSPGGVPTDPYSGGSFVSGERALMNNWPNAINSILGTFIGNGFMNPA